MTSSADCGKTLSLYLEMRPPVFRVRAADGRKTTNDMNSSYFTTPPVVKNLIIVNCLVFLATYLIPPVNLLMARYGILHWFGSPDYHSYQFITYMFLHGNWEHLFFNMFALWMFGRELEYALGGKRFLVYYMVCGVGAALLQMGIAGLTGEFGIRLLGASGAVMGLLLAFGVLWPNSVIMLIFPPISLKAKWFVIGYAVIELLLGATGRDPGVAHFAHIGGMLWGLALLLYWRRRGFVRF